ncbi:uncharacterized protein I303_107080 [Kwoniella dejecticola CBS 10117]|uniref:Uncharacterized protein n=1 Tax=Kwoniella dejecticola CBS 10117 TaxID=1296121 RepID=A0A1A5ZYP0_9TREE|nr:uncharacterized protein I303_06481 [Kwoniella dejecticola CBS 10117]OBR82923.1 hypothetical protein I303_06481 [Kwoniella dejecticola CBS 10117]
MEASDPASGPSPSASANDAEPASGSTPYNATIPSTSASTSTPASSSRACPNPHPNVPSGLGLPQFAQRNGSVSSLMDAVMGPNSNAQSPQQASPAHYIPTPTALKTSNNPLTGRNPTSGLGHGSGSASGSNRLGGAGEGLGDWDILGDVTGRINEGAGVGHGHGKPQSEEAVKALQEKVDKRKSQLPHLENELAALEAQLAQIQATEERLKRAAGGVITTGQK